MSLDLRTLFVIAIFASTVAGLLLLLSWLQTRNVRALAWRAAAFIIGAVGVVLIAVAATYPISGRLESQTPSSLLLTASCGVEFAISRAIRRPCLSCSLAQQSGSLPVRLRNFSPRRKLALR